jgi:hypothetical protein
VIRLEPGACSAQKAYAAADRERVQTYLDVIRLEEELARAQMSTSEFSVLGSSATTGPIR